MLRQRVVARSHLLCASQSHGKLDQTAQQLALCSSEWRVEQLPSVSDEVFDEFAL